MKKNNFQLTQAEKRNVFNDEANTFKILVATDNHLGHKEGDPIRGNDSFDAFEEVLKVAKNEKVDFLLLGGDLFHETNPSQQCLFKTLNLLGNYVLGDGEIGYEMPNYTANFQDYNLNIELPIFIIHGNHDYPSNEFGNLSVVDLLHSVKYLNHFGKFSNIETFKVTPIIFQKGNTTIALYGVGYLKDKYFHKMLEEGKIEFVKPSDLGYENTVNMLIIHQNRFKGIKQGQSYRNCVHPDQFPPWIDFIIRGHEHEQLDEIDTLKECPIATIQPGSTVLTALEESQATPRRAILFEIKGTEANFQDITLIQSYRPVLYEHIELPLLLKKQGFNLETENPSEVAIEELLWLHIQNSIKNFKQALKENFPECQHLLVKKPQLRYKIEHSNIDIFNFSRIESKLSEFVANPGEVLKFWKRIIINPKAINNNPKLEEDFIKTLKGKTDFDTIGNDTVKDIRELYEIRIKKSKSISCLPPSFIMNTLEKVNLRNRNSQIEDIIKELQAKLQENVAVVEEKEIKRMNEQYRQQMNNVLQRISINIDDRQLADKDLKKKKLNNSDKIVYKTIMNNQLEDLKSNVNTKIKNKVVELFTQDFEMDDDAAEEDQNGETNDENNGEKTVIGKERASTGRKSRGYFDEEDDEDDDNMTMENEQDNTKKVKGRKQAAQKKNFKSKKGQLGSEDEEFNEFDEEEDDAQRQFNKGNIKNKTISKAANKPKGPQKGKGDKLTIKLESSDDQDEEEERSNRFGNKGNKNNNSTTKPSEKENISIAQKSGFKQKKTYAQMFNKESTMEEEDNEYNQNSDNNSDQSDCDFGLEGEQQQQAQKRISYNIPHISEYNKKSNQNNKSISNKQNNEDAASNALLQQEPTNQSFRQSILQKKKPLQPPKDKDPKDNKLDMDIKEFFKKKVVVVNPKN